VYSRILATNIVPQYQSLPFKDDILGFTSASAYLPIVPTLIGGWGLGIFRGWGWLAAQMMSQLYLLFYGLLFTFLYRSELLSQHVFLSIVPLYLMVFSVFFIIYLWMQKKRFR
jgi:hypothetical protein